MNFNKLPVSELVFVDVPMEIVGCCCCDCDWVWISICGPKPMLLQVGSEYYKKYWWKHYSSKFTLIVYQLVHFDWFQNERQHLLELIPLQLGLIVQLEIGLQLYNNIHNAIGIKLFIETKIL